jgi:homoserine dehydrogenase
MSSITKGLTPYRIGLLGLGAVGASLVQLLQQQQAELNAQAGRALQLVAVAARDPQKVRPISLAGLDWHDNAVELAARPDLDLVVELIGGENGIALDAARARLAQGQDLVTANKAMLALHAAELARLAEANGAQLYYEAAIAGAIPIVKALREGLLAGRIQAISGILNGTCNYILTEMTRTGRSFAEVLAEAQALGYAEADPSMDVDGGDTAHKLCLLEALAFGRQPDLRRLRVAGIRHLSPAVIAAAEAQGYAIKLIGQVVRDARVQPFVEPCLVKKDRPLGRVAEAYNAIEVTSRYAGASFFEGRGAGGEPTAVAVLADIIDAARQRHSPLFSLPFAQLERAPQPSETGPSYALFLRLVVDDSPGVIAELSAIFARNAVSLATLQQAPLPEGARASAELQIITHAADQLQHEATLDSLSASPLVLQAPAVLRIIEG